MTLATVSEHDGPWAVADIPPATPPAAAGTVVPLPPGNPGVIANPKLLECPPGYTKLMGTKTCNKSCAKEKCPAGTTCQAPMSYCM